MPTGSGCGGDTIAQDIFDELIKDNNIDLPSVDLDGPEYNFPDPADNPLYKVPESLTNDLLTTTVVGGDGTFDVIQTAIRNHLGDEYKKGRIAGNEYTKAYIELTTQALSGSIQYLLGKDTAYWQALLIQSQARKAEIEAVTARVQLQTAKAQLVLAVYQAASSKADYALTKMKIATEDANYCLAKKELEVKEAQIEGILADNKVKIAQEDNVISDTAIKQYNLNHILPVQKDLTLEQKESQRAQTIDTRSDGTPIKGLLGKQKDLYTQQITSYQRDAEYKAGKIWLDAWVTQKTMDEGLVPPNTLTNNTINTVLEKLRVNNNLT